MRDNRISKKLLTCLIVLSLSSATGVALAAEPSKDIKANQPTKVTSEQSVVANQKEKDSKTLKADNIKADVKKASTLKMRPGDKIIGAATGYQLRIIGPDGKELTQKCKFTSSNQYAATVNEKGYVTGHNKGRSLISAKYNNETVTSQLIVENYGFTLFKLETTAPTRTWINNNITIDTEAKGDGSSDEFANTVELYNGVLNESGKVLVNNDIKIFDKVNSNASGSNNVSTLNVVNSPRYGVEIRENIKVITHGEYNPTEIANFFNRKYSVTSDKLNHYSSRVEVVDITSDGKSKSYVFEKNDRDILEETAIGFVGSDAWVGITIDDSSSLVAGTKKEWKLIPNLYLGANLWGKVNLAKSGVYSLYNENYLKFKLIDSPYIEAGVMKPIWTNCWDGEYDKLTHPSGELTPYVSISSGKLSLTYEATELSGKNFGRLKKKQFQAFVHIDF